MSAPLFPFRRRWSLNDTVRHVAVNRRRTAFVMALDGGFVFLSADDSGQDPLPLPSGQGRCLCLVPDADEHAFLAGSADGCLSIIEPGVPVPTVLAHFLGESVTCAAASPQGSRACACGKTLHRFDAEGNEAGTPAVFNSAIQAMAFSPEGGTLAVAHRQGLCLLDVQAKEGASRSLSSWPDIAALAWPPAGGALFALAPGRIGRWTVTEKPDGEKEGVQPFSSSLRNSAALRFSSDEGLLLISGLSLPQAWRLAPDGAWAERAPLVLAEQTPSAVSVLEPHPQHPLAAIGYEDGMVLLSPFDGRREILLLPPLGERGAPVAGLVWNREGDCLHVVLQNGLLFLLTLSSVRAYLKATLAH